MSIRRELRLATEAAWKAAQTTAGAGSEPRPGDVFVIPETSHLAVEWAVIDRAANLPPSPPGGAASHRLYAVPADTWRQIGSHDVHVDATSGCGPLSLRCGLGLWLPEETFDPELRSGVLESADLERARRTWRTIERGAVDATESLHETDTEVEYREWIEKGPARARAMLDRACRLGEILPPAPPFSKEGGYPPLLSEARSASEESFPPFEKGGPGGISSGGRHPLTLAASLLLATTLAAAGGFLWHLRTQTREPGQAVVQSAGAPWTVTLVRTRGVPKIRVPSGVRTLKLQIGDSYPEPYRVEVRSEDPPRTIQTSDSLTFVLPTRALPAGEYRVLVLALRDDGMERIGDYRVEIEYWEDEHRP